MRISVRELVAFCFPPEDITPGGGVSDMLAGGTAHRAAQKKRDGEIEKSLSRIFELEGETIELFGRMDAFTDGETPLVEEMKHTRHTPAQPIAEHRAQAVCYAAMVALERDHAAVQIRISYISLDGEMARQFDETLQRDELFSLTEGWLKQYLQFALRERRHRQSRDASLQALAFPFPAYRAGQRELAKQVYTAISRKKRLFASLPTGTGKSAAVLFPALKAMGEGKNGKILYLTARNTARQSPLEALDKMFDQGLQARVVTLTAKDKLCPKPARCHPDDCPLADGHYLREPAAVEELLQMNACLTDEIILRTAEKHRLCPFELALTMTGLADVILMDLNYAFDPFAQLKRLFRVHRDMTLLVDEAHHAVDRVRESLSGELDSGQLRQHRAQAGKILGRKHPYYKALSGVINLLRNQEAPEDTTQWQQETLTEGMAASVKALLDEAVALIAQPFAPGLPDVFEMIRLCLPFLYAAERLDSEDYAILWSSHGKERSLCLYCLDPGKEIARITGNQRGSVFFSATLSPLEDMKKLLGGTEEDACFALPSPFPPENLNVYIRPLSTRYQDRGNTAVAVARLIEEMVASKTGHYLVFFSSYAYLRMVQEKLRKECLPSLWIQTPQMTEDDREAFFRTFSAGSEAHLGLCVLGGLFSEGIDLPGERLIGAMVVGVGLATPSPKQSAIRDHYEKLFGDGFHYACRIPGLQKVLQAGGRIIRSESDQGVLVLVDDRYLQPAYRRLLPPHWHLHTGNEIRHPETIVKTREDEFP